MINAAGAATSHSFPLTVIAACDDTGGNGSRFQAASADPRMRIFHVVCASNSQAHCGQRFWMSKLLVNMIIELSESASCGASSHWLPSHMPLRRRAAGRVHLVARDVIYDAKHRHPAVEQANADRKVAQARDEVIGAVDRIDHPVSAERIGAFEGDGSAGVALFADETVIWKATSQPGDDVALACAIGIGDGFVGRRRMRLCEAFDLPVMLENDLARAACEIGGVLEVVSEAHLIGNNGSAGRCKDDHAIADPVARNHNASVASSRRA